MFGLLFSVIFIFFVIFIIHFILSIISIITKEATGVFRDLASSEEGDEKPIISA